LCAEPQGQPFFQDRQRTYQRCPNCRLVFVPRRFWLSFKEEKAVYDLHQNDPNDAGYRRFLSRLTAPLLQQLKPGQTGLDFGCGPGSALAAIMAGGGHRMECYDPFYCDDRDVFKQTYDFICATEVVEHFRQPAKEFTTLFEILKPGGWLGIMTKRVKNAAAFKNWHYIRDPTHICFYSRDTFIYLAKRFGADLHFVDADVVLLHHHSI
jgi:hypothetical protein